MHSLAAIALTFSLALTLTACGPRFTNANIDAINKEYARTKELNEKGNKEVGISPKEVESILGPPRFVESRKVPLETQKKELDLVRYTYEQDGQTLVLHFLDNKLISEVPHLGEKPAEAAIPENKP